jgi:hypothetical protein
LERLDASYKTNVMRFLVESVLVQQVVKTVVIQNEEGADTEQVRPPPVIVY